VNVDQSDKCNPDIQLDLESFPWPWVDSTVEEVKLTHILEHIGSSPTAFLSFIRELWRVCLPSARIDVLVPHPRCDEFLWDVTHVRPITFEGLRMFSQQRNQEMISTANPETPLGIYNNVDFDIVQVKYIWKRNWAMLLEAGKVTPEDLAKNLTTQLNVAKEIQIEMRVVKPQRVTPS